MGPPRAQWAPTGTHWRVTTVTRAVDELSLTLVPVLVGGGGQVPGDTGASGQPFLGPNSQGPCAVSARSRRACLLTVLGAGGRCSGARVGLVMAGVGPLWREIGGQEDVRGASEHRQALFLVPRGACGPGGAAGAEGGACYVQQVRVHTHHRARCGWVMLADWWLMVSFCFTVDTLCGGYCVGQAA